jgi:hypothetical protein
LKSPCTAIFVWIQLVKKNEKKIKKINSFFEQRAQKRIILFLIQENAVGSCRQARNAAARMP